VPKRPASRGQPRRKRERRRYVVPTAAQGPAPPGPDASNVGPVQAASRPSSEARPASSRFAPREYRLVNRELARIGVIATAIFILLAVLTFVL
jgi:hypothetical protein